MVNTLQIKRGQIWIADLNPGFGQELHKKRPVVIISTETVNTNSPLIIVLPLTSQVSHLGPEKILLSQKETGLHKKSAVLILGVRSIDKDRLLKKVCSVTQDSMLKIEDSLKLLLGLDK